MLECSLGCPLMVALACSAFPVAQHSSWIVELRVCLLKRKFCLSVLFVALACSSFPIAQHFSWIVELRMCFLKRKLCFSFLFVALSQSLNTSLGSSQPVCDKKGNECFVPFETARTGKKSFCVCVYRPSAARIPSSAIAWTTRKKRPSWTRSKKGKVG